MNTFYEGIQGVENTIACLKASHLKFKKGQNSPTLSTSSSVQSAKRIFSLISNNPSNLPQKMCTFVWRLTGERGDNRANPSQYSPGTEEFAWWWPSDKLSLGPQTTSLNSSKGVHSNTGPGLFPDSTAQGKSG